MNYALIFMAIVALAIAYEYRQKCVAWRRRLKRRLNARF